MLDIGRHLRLPSEGFRFQFGSVDTVFDDQASKLSLQRPRIDATDTGKREDPLAAKIKRDAWQCRVASIAAEAVDQARQTSIATSAGISGTIWALTSE